MTRAAYIPSAPVVEDGGGVFLIHLGNDRESLALTPHNFEMFLEAGRRAVVAWHAAQEDVVVPMVRGSRRRREA